MDSRVESILDEAFLREAERAARCEAYARVAEEEGHARLADVLRATSRGALEHTRGLLTYMGEVGTSEENLRRLAEGDRRAGEDVFRQLAQTAGEAWDGALAEYCQRIVDSKARSRAELESVLGTLGPLP